MQPFNQLKSTVDKNTIFEMKLSLPVTVSIIWQTFLDDGERKSKTKVLNCQNMTITKYFYLFCRRCSDDDKLKMM